MEGIIGLLGDQFVGFHAHHHVRGLDADHQIAVSQVLDDGDLVKGAFHQALGGDAAVFGQNLLFERAGVHAHPDRDSPLRGFIDHGFDALSGADISGVDADFIRAVLNGGHRQPVVEMDIRHQRDVDLLLDLLQRGRSLHGGHRHPDDLAARLFQAQDLGDRGLYILRLCIAHGLDQHRVAAANEAVTDFYSLCVFSCHVVVSLFRIDLETVKFLAGFARYPFILKLLGGAGRPKESTGLCLVPLTF